MHQHSRDHERRAERHRRRRPAVLLRIAWLLFCGYALSGLSCPQYLAELGRQKLDAISAALDPLQSRISQLLPSIPSSCNPGQASAAAAAMRELLELCARARDLERQLGELNEAVHSTPDQINALSNLKAALEGTSSNFIGPRENCWLAMVAYSQCNPADAALLNAWYQSGDATVPPLPGYEQEPRGQPPTTGPAPSYTPPPDPGPG